MQQITDSNYNKLCDSAATKVKSSIEIQLAVVQLLEAIDAAIAAVQSIQEQHLFRVHIAIW